MAFLVFSPAVISGVVDCKTGIYYRGTYKDLFNFISTWKLSISDPMNPKMFLIFNFKRRMCFISKSVGSLWAQKALMPFVTLMEIKNKEKISFSEKKEKRETTTSPDLSIASMISKTWEWDRRRSFQRSQRTLQCMDFLANLPSMYYNFWHN